MSAPELVSAQLSAAERVKLCRALNALPYSGQMYPTQAGALDVETLLAWLNSFASVLHDAAERAAADRRELNQLRADVEAVRRLFGAADS